MKTYILIDFENVQPNALSPLDRANTEVWVFTGSNQRRIRIETAMALQALGDRACYVPVTGSGRNALRAERVGPHILTFRGQAAAPQMLSAPPKWQAESRLQIQELD